MKVIFSHGKESGPWGSKIQRLASIAREADCDIDSIDYRGLEEPEARVERLVGFLEQSKDPAILVGSSMGGYVSLVASGRIETASLFLLAPALYMEGYDVLEYPVSKGCTEIVHGWSDEIIPPDNSIRYARTADCTLHLISGDHRLNSSIDTITVLFRQFLAAVVATEQPSR